ncbi:ABC-F family ATP-binding cassette domain-containing protein [Lacrimispora saccharolytica]|uniref:ABC transporter related protein n=1 Tax=Lacrimispora saccharolytica (strain ATCC 35040 / DSM 2544 / NRCC 2533 / WM1) TaxID=610130 RepID=D9R2K4_LACSW|nr:ABC-F family ATP-binding cassette domain-containing protein [Lacrimispora saccharolytica]ADL06628.1 ABC transporter related protein [[Clostridium] saccharolyticum WM1]QRV19299.1 ABC-F family ATP-binding cassette domain-containing protein [Lacrimispora saccharolytica]
MNLLTIEHLTKSYTERLLFDDTSFSINEGDKIGLIGINGTGKSTLLRMVSGLEEPDQGTVVKGRNLDIRFLSQNPRFWEGDTILESIVRDNEGHDHVWDLESQAKAMLTRLGFTDFDSRVETLSGGQRKRVALVSVLLGTADLLVLDEPTNHLDSSMADWLEDYLRRFKGALLMVTHDRYFLDSVTNRIVELDKGKLYSYQENYEGYLKLKAERMDMEAATERKRQSILKVELEWMQRGARARSTKQKAHIQRYETLRDQKGPEADQTVELDSIASRLGRTTVELQEITKAFGEKVLMKNFTYIFLKNDRIGIIGPNGSGKSTFMKIIAGWLTPDSGTVTIGQTVKMGYFSQESEDMDESVKVIDYIRNVAEFVKTKEGSVSASQMLERFLFPPSVQYTNVGKLSGGEKRRLYLLRILMEAPNVLLLDEPTNDLDIQTLTILEDYLDSFQGIVVAVSHDRYFLDRVVRRIFAFEGQGQVTQYEGGYTDYQAAFQERYPQSIPGQAEGNGKGTQATEKKSREKPKGERKFKFSFKEQREWDTIEEDMAALEEKIQALDKQILEAARDFSRLNALMEDKSEQERLLEEKMERWMYLNDLAEKIQNQ